MTKSDEKPVIEPLSKYYGGIRPEVASILPGHYSKVLEIGCGEGNFSHSLTLPCECWGIEPVIAAAEIAKTKLFKVLRGTYQEVQSALPDNYFDLIICNDVIEHMVDPGEFLEMIKLKLSDDACLVGSVPNVRFVGNLKELLLERDWQYKDGGILDRTHLRFFTQKSLQRTLQEHQYRIEIFEGINSSLPKWRSLRKLIRYVGYRLTEVLTLGSTRDIKYRQFAFRIRLAGQKTTRRQRRHILCS